MFYINTVVTVEVLEMFYINTVTSDSGGAGDVLH